jgi:hypothetical protein
VKPTKHVELNAAIENGKSKKAREIRYAIDLYKTEHPEEAGEPLAPERLAAWIEKRRILNPIVFDPVEIRTKQIVRFLSRATQIDPQGREVRANAVNFQVVKSKSGLRRRSRWLPLFQAPEEFAKAFFAWRRNGALADVVASETDRESYNENNVHGARIEQPSLDFTIDVIEKKLPASYPQSAPDDEDEDDL